MTADHFNHNRCYHQDQYDGNNYRSERPCGRQKSSEVCPFFLAEMGKTFLGGVAALELGRSSAIVFAKLDRDRAEQAENGAVRQNSPPIQRKSAKTH